MGLCKRLKGEISKIRQCFPPSKCSGTVDFKSSTLWSRAKVLGHIQNYPRATVSFRALFTNVQFCAWFCRVFQELLARIVATWPHHQTFPLFTDTFLLSLSILVDQLVWIFFPLQVVVQVPCRSKFFKEGNQCRGPATLTIKVLLSSPKIGQSILQNTFVCLFQY